MKTVRSSLLMLALVGTSLSLWAPFEAHSKKLSRLSFLGEYCSDTFGAWSRRSSKAVFDDEHLRARAEETWRNLEAIPEGSLTLENLKKDGRGLVEELYEEIVRPDEVFTPKQIRSMKRWNRIENILNRGLVVISAPVWVPTILVAMLITKLDSPGPVIFVQERIGREGKPFKIYKLRTMKYAEPGTEYRATAANDSRITRSGEFFRRWKIDEFFQMINILKGDMGIVGFRPLVEKEVVEAILSDRRFAYTLYEKPGLTSLGQVLHGHAISGWENVERGKYNFDGMLNKGPKLFIQTLVGTVISIYKGTGKSKVDEAQVRALYTAPVESQSSESIKP